MIYSAVLPFIVALTLAAHAVASPSPTDSLRAAIDARIARVPGAVVAVSYRDLASGVSFDVNGDTSFHAASTMKVPVMIELFRMVERGELSLDQGILLVNEFGSLVDGSPFSVDAAD